MKIKKRLLSLALSGAMMLSLVPAFSMTALAADNVSTYTLQIPSTLNVSAAGWNETSGLTAAVTENDTFDSGKKLSVTAASANSWALVSGSNSIGYNLATATGDYSSTATPASWEFTAAELNASGGTNKAMGIVVEDYSSKPAGTYQDTVTFTAKVEDAATVLAPALENNATVVIAYRWGGNTPTTFTFTNNGGTYSCNIEGVQASAFSGSLTLNDTTLALSITNSVRSDPNLAINFDTTNDTYRFVTKNSSWYNSHTVSVNGTDITSKLTEAE